MLLPLVLNAIPVAAIRHTNLLLICFDKLSLLWWGGWLQQRSTWPSRHVGPRVWGSRNFVTQFSATCQRCATFEDNKWTWTTYATHLSASRAICTEYIVRLGQWMTCLSHFGHQVAKVVGIRVADMRAWAESRPRSSVREHVRRCECQLSTGF